MPRRTQRKTVSRTFTIWMDQMVDLYTLEQDYGLPMNEVVRNALEQYIPQARAEYEEAERLAEERSREALERMEGQGELEPSSKDEELLPGNADTEDTTEGTTEE